MHEPAVNDFHTVFPSTMMSFFKLSYQASSLFTWNFAGLELLVQGGFYRRWDGLKMPIARAVSCTVHSVFAKTINLAFT